MDNRGATRPMMQQSGNGKTANDMHGNKMGMLLAHHKQTVWTSWSLVILGIWLIASPLTFSYTKNAVMPAGGRHVWLSLAERITYAKWNDIISGCVLLFFSIRSLKPNRPVSLWICCFVGIWLTVVPIIFWCPSAIAYLNDTFSGIMAIALSILIPGMPNMVMYMKMGSEVPDGWTYNPSSWAQRWIMAVTGFSGFLVSRYLAAYQLGYSDYIWDPFFSDSSMNVLTSNVSKSLPVSDAGLGSIAYTFEFLMGLMGSPSRWRTMPWMVTFFGILVVPLGFVHIFLVISQPVTVGAWCTFCIAAATIMLPMIPLEIDEVIAMGQHMKQSIKKGEGAWMVFWKGGTPISDNKDQRTPPLHEMHTAPIPLIQASFWGMSAPWTLITSALLGIVLITAPAYFHLPIKGGIADSNHIFGALFVVFSVISMGEVIRVSRFANIIIGALLIYYSARANNAPAALGILNIIVSLIAILLSLPKGKIKEKYGIWQSFIK